jgi:hypothetical protein
MKGFFFFVYPPGSLEELATPAIPILLNPFRVSVDISGFTPGCTRGYSYSATYVAFAPYRICSLCEANERLFLFCVPPGIAI